MYVGSPDQIIRRRPDVLQAERQLAAQALFVGAARAEYLPRVTFGARAGYSSNSVDSLFKRGNSRLLVGPVDDFPALRPRAGAPESGSRAGRPGRGAGDLQRDGAARARRERRSARDVRSRARAPRHSRERVRSSARAADLAQQRFEAGLTDFLQVLDAERTLLDAENQLAQGHTAAATALVAVYKAVGGTWPIK